jgi:hypothetical protein
MEPLGPVEVPEPDVVDIPEPDVVDIPEPGIVEVPQRRAQALPPCLVPD